MSIIFKSIENLVERYATIDTLSRIIATITPIIIAKDHIVNYFKSYIPSYVERIVHFDTENGKITEKYVAKKNWYSIKNGVFELMGLPKEGYYMFVVWNSFKLSYERYVLQADLVEKALETKNVHNMWAFHDYAIVLMLSNFVSYSNIGATRIVGISLNREDVTKMLKPFMKSLNIPNNVRPNLLYMLTRYLDHDNINMISLRNSLCMYTNDDMDEIRIGKSNGYLIRSSAESYPIHHTCCTDDEHEFKQDITHEHACARRSSNHSHCCDGIEELYEDRHNTGADNKARKSLEHNEQNKKDL